MRIINGRRHETRDELATRHGVSPRTLSNAWRDRDTNGHPDAETVIGDDPTAPRARTLYWPSVAFDQWVSETKPFRTKAAAGPTVPEGMGGPAEFAQLCGHGDTSLISRWVSGDNTPPPEFPTPDYWHPLASGRKRPYWHHERMQEFAQQYTPTTPGRPKGRKGYRYQGDARLERARRLLARRPDLTTEAAVTHLQTKDNTNSSPRSWAAIVRTARHHPTPET
ncbi:hypothetical protein ACIQU6_30710 [Streptomyces sp. NPDC090442]|uniref:hypothetical protein n=1 Tax=Streptomyces sp. NPDC090442 TaxID=3365962 RepID=UPI0038069B2C